MSIFIRYRKNCQDDYNHGEIISNEKLSRDFRCSSAFAYKTVHARIFVPAP